MISSVNNFITLMLYGLSSKNIWTESLAIILSDGIVVLTICAYVFIILPLRKKGLYVRTVFHDFLPATIALAFAYVLKILTHEVRPYVALHLQPLTIATDPLASFPSSHVVFMTAFATTLMAHHRRLGILVAGLIPLVMIGRIAVGVHWFTDVLAGLVIGFVVAYLYEWLISRRNNKS